MAHHLHQSELRHGMSIIHRPIAWDNAREDCWQARLAGCTTIAVNWVLAFVVLVELCCWGWIRFLIHMNVAYFDIHELLKWQEHTTTSAKRSSTSSAFDSKWFSYLFHHTHTINTAARGTHNPCTVLFPINITPVWIAIVERSVLLPCGPKQQLSATAGKGCGWMSNHSIDMLGVILVTAGTSTSVQKKGYTNSYILKDRNIKFYYVSVWRERLIWKALIYANTTIAIIIRLGTLYIKI